MSDGHGWVKPLPNGAKARCMGPPGCPDCVVEWEALNAEHVIPCQCGRPMKLLNYISPRISCVGCGQPSEECRCSMLVVPAASFTLDDPTPRYTGEMGRPPR